LGQQRRVEEKEGEAPTEAEAADVVRIRTIHNAKGLESNVVILGGLSRNMVNSSQRPAFLFDRKSGAGGCQYPHPDSFKSQASAAYSVLAQAQEQKDLDESLRLLYVAMTRAREYLILAGAYPATARTWAGRILPCLGVNAAPEEDAVLETVPGLQITVRSKVPGHRLQPTPTRQAMERIQGLMKHGEPVTDEDLENLR
ncbi:MAG: hypothetical protein M3Y56_04885, partial [Armatimonadota bacterium]|nr:hypothetical protein [Armatimonadota bacterium]